MATRNILPGPFVLFLELSLILTDRCRNAYLRRTISRMCALVFALQFLGRVHRRAGEFI